MKGQSSILLVFGVIVGCLAKPPPTFLEYKDSLGQYSFGYSAPGSARSEVRSSDGTTRGSYSYVDVLGNIQSAQYTADGENGFQIVATNLPQAPRPVEDTPEVTAAKIDHFKALEAASKLAEGKSEGDQISAIGAVKSANPVSSAETPENNGDGMDIQAQTMSPDSPQAIGAIRSVDSQNTQAKEINEVGISAQLRNADDAPAMTIGSSMESQNAKSEGPKEASVKTSTQENESVAAKALNKPTQDGSSKGDANSAELSGRSDVPVVTTSFVIPGSLNLQTRIQLDHSDGAAARIAPAESAASSAAEPSTPQSQGADLNPSNVSPAATGVIPEAERKNAEILAGTSSLPPTSVIPMQRINAEEHSGTTVHALIAPANVYGFAYGIGINPIYRHYSPYHYLPYAIL